MMTLLIKQSLKNGSSKSWRLRSAQDPQTFGSSRLAKLISINPTSEGIEGVFEFKNGTWFFHHLNFKNLQTDQSPTVEIKSEIKLIFGESEIVLSPIHREENLMQKLEQIRTTGLVSKNSKQLFIAKQNDRVIEVKVLDFGQKYRGITAAASDVWTYHNAGAMKIQQRSVQMEDLKRFTHLSIDQLVDQDSKKGVYAVLGVTALFLVMALFGPSKQEELIMADLPKVAQKIIVKTDLKPRKKTQAQQTPKAVPQTSPAPKVAEKVNDTKGGKVANMLKSISGGRISQLIGKVSSQAAKSANVVITNGVKAGQGGSGRALAALGSVEKSGRNWGTESGGKDVVVSTAGLGGGKNASGMGSLAAGGTGSGGVGLIEEESEISGGLDREIIAQYIKSQLGQILYCYERQLSASPDLFGKIAVKFTIGGNGGVEKQLIGDTTLKNATVEGCILNRVAAWKFPAPQGGTKVLVTYPFLFKSTN